MGYPKAGLFLEFIQNQFYSTFYVVSFWFPMSNRCWDTTGMHLPAQFTWFLLVSYALPVSINHRTLILLHGSPGFFCFLMADRWLNTTGIHLPVGSFLVSVHLVAQFTWFLLVSYGQPVGTLHQKLGMPLWCTVWPWPIIAYKSRDVHLVAQFTWFLVCW